MGKVLVEKLLRDCPEIKTCYLLMRTKRGVEPEQRRDDYLNHMVFSVENTYFSRENVKINFFFLFVDF